MPRPRLSRRTTLTEASFIVGIPARYASQRLPGKPLRELAGKALIAHVIERAKESAAEAVVVAADDERVAEAAREAGAEVCMTDADCASGTDRLAQCAERLGWPDDRIVVNLQGDEPLLPGRWLDRAAGALARHAEAKVATLAVPEHDASAVFNPNVVKVAVDDDGLALYFSRAPVPWHRERFREPPARLPEQGTWFRHVGLYAYRAGYLRELADMTPAVLEQVEQLEQLRVLAAGDRIHVSIVDHAPPAGVDTEEDLARLEALLSKTTQES